MKSIKIAFLISIAVASAFLSSAQSILNPADPVITYNSSAPPTEPVWGQIGKWVRTVRLSWNTDSYKAYIYKGVPFRLKFPKTYNPLANDGKKYPMFVFFHGLGEAGVPTDNEFQLYHGGQFFSNSVDNGTFDGFVLCMQSQGYWGTGHYDFIKEIIDYMIINNKLDPFQIIENGLSAGGQASWDMMYRYPSLICASIPMSWTSYFYAFTDYTNKLKFTPIWNFQGGLDGAPSPQTSEYVRDSFLFAGANYQYTEYPDLGHGTWDRVWNEPQFWPFLLGGYASNLWPLHGRTDFCPGDVINDTLGVSPGYDSYQWRKDGVVVQNGTSNFFAATQVGIYDVRVLKGSTWSEWSRKSVQIKIKGATVSPNIIVSGLASRVLPGLDGSTSVKFEVPAGYASYNWQQNGDPTVLSTNRFLTVSNFGDYKVKVTEQFGCSSNFSNLMSVVNANGNNKPDPAINLLATTLSKTSIRLDWSDNPSPQFNETNFEIYRSLQTGGPYVFAGITGADIKSFSLTGLDPNTTYYFKVRAVNNTAASTPSNEASGTTQIDSQPPTSPGSLTITSSTKNSISIGWTASTDDVGVVLYEIFVNGIKSYATTTTNFLVSGLQASNSYNIVVRAKDFAGNYSPFSNQVTGQALLRGLDYKYYSFATAPNQLPDFISLVPTTTGTVANVTLIPRAIDFNFGFLWEGYINIPVAGSYIFRTNSDDGSRLYLGSLNGQGSPYSFSATPLVNNDGNHGSQNADGAITLAKGTYPIAITYYQGVGGFNCDLYWQTPQTAGSFTKIPDTVFADKPIVLGTPPSKPTNLTATTFNYKRIDISWTDNSTNETGFEIWRSTNPVANFTTIGVVAGTGTTGTINYKDSSLNPNTKYYYRVRAVNQYGESDFDRIGQGIDYNYYEVDGLTNLPDFNSMTSIKTGRVNNFGLGMQNKEDNFQVKFAGTINIPTAGIYTFYSASDDGSRIYIDGFNTSSVVVDNDYTHGLVEKSGSKSLTAGQHSIYLIYFESVGGQSLDVKISAPGLPKQSIPDSYLGNALVSATTSAPASVPAVPSSLVAGATSKSAIKVTWVDNASTETKYELYRSNTTHSNYILYATLPANTTQFLDSGLFANAIFYYKVRALGSSNNSAYATEDSAKTWNTSPVIVQLPSVRTAKIGANTVITLSASDSDGDLLNFSSLNLPAFATLVNNGNNTATLTLSPSASGTYNNVKISVTDPNSGSDFTQFNIIANNNADPVIGSISDYVVNENDNLNIPLTATDLNAADVLTWSVTNLPNVFILTPGSNGFATLALHPNYAASGNYAVKVTVSDGNGGYGIKTFNFTVNDKYPNSKIYIRIRHDSYNTIGAPWNTVTGSTSSNFIDDKNNTTTIGLNFPNGYNTGNGGYVTNNNSGVYPDAVIRDYYVFGAPWMNQTANAVITGLDPARKYSLTLLGSSNWNIAPDNGSTNYTVGGQTLSIYVQNNSQNTVSFNNITPAADGSITIAMAKGTGASAGFLNSIVINSLFDDGSIPIVPVSLTAQNISGQGVQLNWQNLAYNETGYEIHRATNAAGPFTNIGLASGSEVTSYSDNTVSGNSTYYYKIRAVSVGNLLSAFSNVVSIKTINKIPVVTAISNVFVKSLQTITVPVTATDDATDLVNLSAENLPQFVTFTDNGNKTGSININPLGSSVGVYKNIIITAKDNNGGTSSTSFDITVLDKDVYSIYLNFTDVSNLPSRPWNNLSNWPNPGTTFSSLKDDRDSVWTSVSVNLLDGFNGIGATGARPGNGKEIYPTTVIRTGLYEQSTNTKRIQISGLDNAKKYNFVFFNSHEDGTDGTTNFTVNGSTVSLNAAYNTEKTVQINGITPVSNVITITVTKPVTSSFSYLSSMIIEAYTPASLPVVAPSDLRVVSAMRKSINLTWRDRSDNENIFEIYRAASGGSYVKIGTVSANITSYTDSDVNLNSNTSYFYIVRAVRTNPSTLNSNYSNVASGTTYAYSVYINFTNSLQAGAPWNNLATIPQIGYVWKNFRDESNFITSIGMVETGQWAGMYTVGMNTGNNSGVYPDNVLIESYGLFPGQISSVKVTGLNLSMKYDFTFFASAQHTGDVNTSYTVNGKTVLLNTAQNKTGTVTMYGIVPDQFGEVSITIAPGTPTSQYGLLGALTIQGFTPAATVIPAPASRTLSQDFTERTPTSGLPKSNTVVLVAYPNPFKDYFMLNVVSDIPDNIDIQLYDINGKTVYQNKFGNINSGSNLLKIQPDKVLMPGFYFVKATLGISKSTSVVKLIKL